MPNRRHVIAASTGDVEFALPETVKITPQYLVGKPMWVKNQRNSWHGIDFFYASDRRMQDYLKDYYGALSAVDDSVGRIWRFLETRGLEDETILVFYSDNGFLIGVHGLIDKRNAYEGFSAGAHAGRSTRARSRRRHERRNGSQPRSGANVSRCRRHRRARAL